MTPKSKAMSNARRSAAELPAATPDAASPADPAATLEQLLGVVQAMSKEVTAMRRGQAKMFKAIHDMRHEMGYRVGTIRDDLGALLKASHADLSERFDTIETVMNEHHNRFGELERELDELFEAT